MVMKPVRGPPVFAVTVYVNGPVFCWFCNGVVIWIKELSETVAFHGPLYVTLTVLLLTPAAGIFAEAGTKRELIEMLVLADFPSGAIAVTVAVAGEVPFPGA